MVATPPHALVVHHKHGDARAVLAVEEFLQNDRSMVQTCGRCVKCLQCAHSRCLHLSGHKVVW
jgi:hypothetical protein